MNCPPPFDDAAKTVHSDLPEGVTRRGKSLMVQVLRINVGSFADTEAGLDKAKLTHQRCKAYSKGECERTEMKEIREDLIKKMDEKMMKKKNP